MLSAAKNGALFGGFSRLRNFPLDNSSVFQTENEFREYLTENVDRNSLAYKGQIVAILDLHGIFYVNDTKRDDNQYSDCYFKLADMFDIAAIQSDLAALETSLTTLINNLETSLNDARETLTASLNQANNDIATLTTDVSKIKDDYTEMLNAFYSNKALVASQIEGLLTRVGNLETNVDSRISTINSQLSALITRSDTNDERIDSAINALTGWLEPIKDNLIALSNKVDKIIDTDKLNAKLNDYVTVSDLQNALISFASGGELNLTSYAKKTEVSAEIEAKIAELVDGAPEAFDTLKEIAAVLNEDNDAAASILTTISGKANLADVPNISISDTNGKIQSITLNGQTFTIDNADPNAITAQDLSTALQSYLTSVDAASTYITKTEGAALSDDILTLSGYVSDLTNAAVTQETLESTLEDYVKADDIPEAVDLTDYLQSSTAASTYSTISYTNEELQKIRNSLIASNIGEDNEFGDDVNSGVIKELPGGTILKRISVVFYEDAADYVKSSIATSNVILLYNVSDDTTEKVFITSNDIDIEALQDANQFPITFDYDMHYIVPDDNKTYELRASLYTFFDNLSGSETKKLGSVRLVYV